MSSVDIEFMTKGDFREVVTFIYNSHYELKRRGNIQLIMLVREILTLLSHSKAQENQYLESLNKAHQKVTKLSPIPGSNYVAEVQKQWRQTIEKIKEQQSLSRESSTQKVSSEIENPGEAETKTILKESSDLQPYSDDDYEHMVDESFEKLSNRINARLEKIEKQWL